MQSGDNADNDDLYLNGELESAQWAWINPHANRDRVIILAASLDIAAVAKAFVDDDQIQVQAWITAGKITKPSLSQLETWRKEPAKEFRVRIVQPWVIVQEFSH